VKATFFYKYEVW